MVKKMVFKMRQSSCGITQNFQQSQYFLAPTPHFHFLNSAQPLGKQMLCFLCHQQTYWPSNFWSNLIAQLSSGTMSDTMVTCSLMSLLKERSGSLVHGTIIIYGRMAGVIMLGTWALLIHR